MSPFRFLHSSDLHLGRPFASLEEPEGTGLRGRLVAARHQALTGLAAAARSQGARDILLAGDTFDSATPSAAVWRQALSALAEATDLTWWLLPGNHDNLRDAEPLWDALANEAPANLRLLRDLTPVQIAPSVTLLPVPVTFRNPGQDLTEALVTAPSPEGDLRLGLAHGGVVDFDEGGASIPPDRDRSAALDYLGLGDWHGRLAVGPRIHYPGSPEQDRFKHDRRGCALAVTLPGPGALPEVTEIETGQFLWQRIELPLLATDDPKTALEEALPDSGRRETLLQLQASGRTTLTGHNALRQAIEAVAPTFALFDLNDTLRTEGTAGDLDAIDRAGALRLAADRLAAQSIDPGLSEAEREIAGAALNRLFALAMETQT